MNLYLLLLIPSLGLFTWRPEWPSALVLLGFLAFILIAEALERKADWRSAAISGIRAETVNLSGRLKALEDISEHGRARLTELATKTKGLEDTVEGHARTLQQAATHRKSIL